MKIINENEIEERIEKKCSLKNIQNNDKIEVL
jgi:hypothetical protein